MEWVNNFCEGRKNRSSVGKQPPLLIKIDFLNGLKLAFYSRQDNKTSDFHIA